MFRNLSTQFQFNFSFRNSSDFAMSYITLYIALHIFCSLANDKAISACQDKAFFEYKASIINTIKCSSQFLNIFTFSTTFS